MSRRARSLSHFKNVKCAEKSHVTHFLRVMMCVAATGVEKKKKLFADLTCPSLALLSQHFCINGCWRLAHWRESRARTYRVSQELLLHRPFLMIPKNIKYAHSAGTTQEPGICTYPRLIQRGLGGPLQEFQAPNASAFKAPPTCMPDACARIESHIERPRRRVYSQATH